MAGLVREPACQAARMHAKQRGSDGLSLNRLCVCSACCFFRHTPTLTPSPSHCCLLPPWCSVPQAIIDQLSPTWTARLPIVICSRCGVGRNCDDWLYKGSRQKYESRGFVLGGGYKHLNPLQARSLLVLRLAALGHA